jgi:hypothetical protein
VPRCDKCCVLHEATLLQILGVPANADSQRIESAYRKKKMLAEKKGDAKALKEIEQAHNAIFMASLNSRLSVRTSPLCPYLPLMIEYPGPCRMNTYTHNML